LEDRSSKRGSPPVWVNPALQFRDLLLHQAATRSQTIEVDIPLTTTIGAILVHSTEATTRIRLVPDDCSDERSDGAGAVLVHDVCLSAVLDPISVVVHV
jgi:hypothetical protein